MDCGLFHGSALLNVKSIVLNDNRFCCSALQGNFDGLSHDRFINAKKPTCGNDSKCLLSIYAQFAPTCPFKHKSKAKKFKTKVIFFVPAMILPLHCLQPHCSPPLAPSHPIPPPPLYVFCLVFVSFGHPWRQWSFILSITWLWYWKLMTETLYVPQKSLGKSWHPQSLGVTFCSATESRAAGWPRPLPCTRLPLYDLLLVTASGLWTRMICRGLWHGVLSRTARGPDPKSREPTNKSIGGW